MNRSLGEIEGLILGTVGLPGEREFYLQIKKGEIVSLALEKNQAASLAEKIIQIAREVGLSVKKQNATSSSLEMPIAAEFSVGMISLTWLPDGARLRIEINAAEEESENPKSINFEYEMGKAIEFALCALDVVAAGRQPCLFCGGPINVEGHLCPRANGYRRQI
ncbi:MAG TPA: DUF3090 family protein [Candidatus Nanopelagicaceae bacterium]|jgi:uncharacterized repeat protein (TIGR03847 family)